VENTYTCVYLCVSVLVWERESGYGRSVCVCACVCKHLCGETIEIHRHKTRGHRHRYRHRDSDTDTDTETDTAADPFVCFYKHIVPHTNTETERLIDTETGHTGTYTDADTGQKDT
jgi:hypothetical protein